MRAAILPLWVVLLLAAGCVTPADQEAVVRGAKFAAQTGGETGTAVSGELWQVAADIGAVEIDAQGGILPRDVDPEAVVVSAAAANAGAATIARERGARSFYLDLAKNFGAELLGHLPWGGPVLAGLGTCLALWRKYKGAAGLLVKSQGTVEAGVTLIQRAKEKLADGKLTLEEFKALFAEANEAGPQFVAGAADLKAEYNRLRAEWSADGTPIKSV